MSADAAVAFSRGLRVAPVVRSLAFAVGVGFLWGLVSSLVNVAPMPLLQALGQITGQRWSWCVIAFCIGLALRRVSWAPIFGVVCLVAAMIGYFGMDLLRGVYTRGGGDVKWDWFWNDLTTWAQAGVIAGAAFGLAGALTRRGGIVGALGSMALPAAVMHPAILARQPLVIVLAHSGPLTWLALAAATVSTLLLARAIVASLRQRRGERRNGPPLKTSR